MKKKIAIIGGGSSGLFLAAFLDTKIYDVTIYEKKKSLGRKFLVAGDGGFNLTHSEEISSFKARYMPSSFLNRSLDLFNNKDLQTWLLDLGIPTFVGSSGRVFPKKGIKPIEVLKTIEDYLIKKGVRFEFNNTFIDWANENSVFFNSNYKVEADYFVFALGGCSWRVTGSDGEWLKVFREKSISTKPFRSSNCAFMVNWPEKFVQKFKGIPLKNISISINNKTQKGEAVITSFGMEGNAIYGLSHEIQNYLESANEAKLFIDFKPTLTLKNLSQKLSLSKTNITKNLKEKIKLNQATIELVKSSLTKEEFLDLDTLAQRIKRFPIRVVDAANIDEAISTEGGISLDAINSNFELKKRSNNFCIGEMLDWNAPTGGYLIQACASMGVSLAKYLNSENKKNV